MESILNTWHPSWAEMPWRTFTDPRERFEVLPTFVIGEFVFIGLALIMGSHALSQGRLHIMVWLGSFITGVANDGFFMMLPLVDNFWQAQASIMLTPRMPLYIPCVYSVFMYTSTVAVWRLRLPVLSEAALTGIMGELIYAPYDITGIKFIWWTWHDTDASVSIRNMGAPVGSTVWVITFTASFQFLLRQCVLNWAEKNPGQTIGLGRLTRGLVLNALLCTPLMMVQMAILQLLSGELQGLPTNRSFSLALAIYGLAIGYGLWRMPRLDLRDTNPLVPHPTMDAILRFAISGYFFYLILNMALARPENHVSTGVHQTVGPCGVEAIDLAGHAREEFLCLDQHQQDWNLNCEKLEGLPPPTNFSEWYTICGEPHSNFGLWLGVIMALGASGIATYNLVLRKRHSPTIQGRKGPGMTKKKVEGKHKLP